MLLLIPPKPGKARTATGAAAGSKVKCLFCGVRMPRTASRWHSQQCTSAPWANLVQNPNTAPLPAQ